MRFSFATLAAPLACSALSASRGALRAPLATTLRMCGGSTAPKSLKIYYGDMPFWRAEVVRLALHVGGVPFEDVRDTSAVREAGKLTFGAVPVLEADGKILSQTQAMAVYCAKVAGIHPEDAWQQAKVDEALNGCTDVTGTLGATFRLPDAEKVSARQQLCSAEGRLTLHLGGLERLVGENAGEAGFLVGESLTVADLAVWRLCGWIGGGVIDGIAPEYVAATFPGLARLCAAVDAHPKVAEWKRMHPKFYEVQK